MLNIAAKSVPARFAASTISHMRLISKRLRGVKSDMTGKTTVIVVSVNSCCRESTTIMKPTDYPRLVMRGRHGASGTYDCRTAWAKSEKLIERPAASPDHHKEVTGLAISSWPSRLTIS